MEIRKTFVQSNFKLEIRITIEFFRRAASRLLRRVPLLAHEGVQQVLRVEDHAVLVRHDVELLDHELLGGGDEVLREEVLHADARAEVHRPALPERYLLARSTHEGRRSQI